MSPEKEKIGYLGIAKLLAQALVGIPLIKDQKTSLNEKRRDQKLQTWYAAGTEIGRHVLGSAVKEEVTNSGVSQLFLGAINGAEQHLAVPGNRKEIIEALAPRITNTVGIGLVQARKQIADNIVPIVENISLSVDPGQTAATDTSFTEIRHKLVEKEDSFFTKLFKGGIALAIKGVSEGTAYIGAFVQAKSKGFADTQDEIIFRDRQYSLYRNMLFGAIRSIMGLSPNPRNLSQIDLDKQKKVNATVQKTAKVNLWQNVVPTEWVAPPPVTT